MTKNNLYKNIADCIGIDTGKINTNSNMQNIKEWDSINHIKIILSLEKEYKIKIKTSDFDKFTSIKFIEEYLKKNKKYS